MLLSISKVGTCSLNLLGVSVVFPWKGLRRIQDKPRKVREVAGGGVVRETSPPLTFSKKL